MNAGARSGSADPGVDITPADTLAEIERIVRAQATRAQRLAAADGVIFNGATVTLAQLQQQINNGVARLAL